MTNSKDYTKSYWDLNREKLNEYSKQWARNRRAKLIRIKINMDYLTKKKKIVDFKKLNTCGSCGTTHKTIGLCDYCKSLQESNNIMEDKIKSLISLSKEVIVDFYYFNSYKYESKKNR
jgi:hypothetical protein